MQNHIEVPVVGLDLRVVYFCHRVLDRERMEGERIRENQRLGNRGRRQIDPDERPGCGVQPGTVDALGRLDLPVLVNENRDQSPTFWASAACAAARRATGTRYGDELT